MSLETLLPIALGAMSLVLFVTAYRVQHQRRDRAWRRLAALHDWSFTYSLGTWEVAGLHRGRQFRLHTEQRPSRNRTHLYTVVWLELG
ncbi:hypothetical protein ACLEPN_24685 [Myxococcus sp. 1LA]